MVEVAAGKSGQRQLLAERGDGAPVPARAGECPLAVLPLGAKDRKAVRLKLDPAAEPGLGKPPAGIDGWQGDRLLAADVGRSKALKGPAGDGDVAVAGNPLRVQHRAQPVVAGNVVAAKEGAIGDVTRGTCEAPARAQLKPAIALQISPDPVIAAG